MPRILNEIGTYMNLASGMGVERRTRIGNGNKNKTVSEQEQRNSFRDNKNRIRKGNGR